MQKPGFQVVSVRIRGIYSTAFTRLLLDNSFEIVQPSEIIMKRFGFARKDEEEVSPDLYIRDRQDRQGVIAFGDGVSVEKLIYILRSTLDDAVFRNPLQIKREISGLYGYENSLANIRLSNALNMNLEYPPWVNIEFPSLSKERLDEIRATVTPTVTGHHYYKACGGIISSMVDMAERMIEEGCPRDEVEALLMENIRSRFPREGSRIRMEHVKINGQTFNLGIAKIVRFNGKSRRMILLRRFFKKGVYDGLKIRKGEGDYAITDVRIGDLSFRTRYFSRDGEYKGTYININTPVELYPAKIRYVDLEVDICVWPNGEIRRIDFEKLEEAMARRLIPERLAEIASREIEKIMNSLNLEEEQNAFYLV